MSFSLDWRVRAVRYDLSNTVGIFVLAKQDDGTYMGRPMEISGPYGTHVPLEHEPTVRITANAAQMLLDELWASGLRPSREQESGHD